MEIDWYPASHAPDVINAQSGNRMTVFRRSNPQTIAP
jgi:hypothetical protein